MKELIANVIQFHNEAGEIVSMSAVMYSERPPLELSPCEVRLDKDCKITEVLLHLEDGSTEKVEEVSEECSEYLVKMIKGQCGEGVPHASAYYFLLNVIASEETATEKEL